MPLGSKRLASDGAPRTPSPHSNVSDDFSSDDDSEVCVIVHTMRGKTIGEWSFQRDRTLGALRVEMKKAGFVALAGFVMNSINDIAATERPQHVFTNDYLKLVCIADHLGLVIPKHMPIIIVCTAVV